MQGEEVEGVERKAVKQGGGETAKKSWKGGRGEERFSECHNNL